MRKVVAVFVGLLALTLLSGCASMPKAISADLKESRAHKTQVSMWADRGVRVHGTNYRRGDFIPAGTDVQVESVTQNMIVFTIPTQNNRSIQIVNNRHSGVNLATLFERTFGREEPSFHGATGATRDAMERGEVTEGMTRDQVLLARGYPPMHQTPSLEMHHWRYWNNRFGTKIVRFGDDGKVAEIVN